MALLDSLFNQQDYDPSQLGLLRMLRSLPQLQVDNAKGAQFAPDQSMLPPTAAPTQMMIPQQQQPQQAPMAQPSFWDRIGSGINDNSAMLMGLGAGIAQGGIGRGLQLGGQFSLLDQASKDRAFKSQAARQSMLATYQALKARGLDDQTAIAAASNPTILSTLMPQLFGPKGAPTLTDDPTTGQKLQYDIQTQTWKPLQIDGGSGEPVPQSQDGRLRIPPVPIGGDPKRHREKSTELAAKELDESRIKAEASAELISRIDRAKAKIAGADPNIFGPVRGSDVYQNYIRAPGAAIGIPSDVRLQKQTSEIGSMYADLMSTFLKARFGSQQLSDRDLKAAQAIVGGLTVSDPKTAIKILENLTPEAFDRIKDAMTKGAISESRMKQLLGQSSTQPSTKPQQNDPWGIRY